MRHTYVLVLPLYCSISIERTSYVQVVERILKQPTTGPALVISPTDSRRFLAKGKLALCVCLTCVVSCRFCFRDG
jgi:L-lysine 2,3-aminomutase